MKRIYRGLSLIAGLIVTALFVVYVVRSLRGHDLGIYATPRAAIGIVVAATLWACCVPLLSLAWHALLVGLGIRRTRRELFGIIGVTQFAKYVPGNVAQYVGRVGMSLARGIPTRPLAVTMAIETLLVVTAAIVVGIAAGMLSDIGLQALSSHSVQLTLIALIVASVVAGLFLFRRIALVLVRRFAPRHADALEEFPLPSRNFIAKAFALYCAMYTVMGVGLILLAHFLLPQGPNDHWLLVAVFALAWVIGFVTPGAPGGLGVREGLMVLMLAPVYAPASISILVVALRIATTIGDLCGFVAGLILLPARAEPRTLPQ